MVTEADEIADNIAGWLKQRPATWDEACAIVRDNMGPPSEVGHQLFDNIAESLMRKTP